MTKINHSNEISRIRRDYGNLSLDEKSALASPFSQFELWLDEVLKVELHDPTAMVLSTVDETGHPDSRIVLLKGLQDGAFIFYTNYESVKAQEIKENSNVALNFYWPQMARQVRIRGNVEKVDSAISNEYFATRPIDSQISAIASPQSKIIASREYLENCIKKIIPPIQRPDYWGGYKIIPHEFEFWQGRDNRLHDRIHYFLKANKWNIERLAP